MGGGLLNLVAIGNQNIYLNGNPKKTFFAATYKKYTNFGIQKFRIDYQGNRELNSTTNTIFDFKIPRHADLLYDSYLVVNLPDIYSPFYYYSDAERENNKTKGNKFATSNRRFYCFIVTCKLDIWICINITINNVIDTDNIKTNGLSYVTKPNLNETKHQMWNFLQPPQDISHFS